MKRAVLTMKEVWVIGERIMKDDFGKRIFMFNTLVASGLLYGAEMFGWKEWESLERVQIRYIKWCLGLHRCTPWYLVLDETKIDKVRVRAGERAMKYDQKIRRMNDQRLVKECWNVGSK